MKTLPGSLLGMLVFTVCAAFGGEKTFTIDPVHSGVSFRIRHLYTTFNGRFNAFPRMQFREISR